MVLEAPGPGSPEPVPSPNGYWGGCGLLAGTCGCCVWSCATSGIGMDLKKNFCAVSASGLQLDEQIYMLSLSSISRAKPSIHMKSGGFYLLRFYFWLWFSQPTEGWTVLLRWGFRKRTS